MIRTLLLTSLVACIDTADTTPSTTPTTAPPIAGMAATGTLLVDVLDVGQGDAILLRSAGKVVLIDGGPSAEQLLAGLRERQVDHIDLMIATHPHADHIGGLDDALKAWDVSVFIDSGDTHTTASYDRLMDAVEDEGMRYQTAAVGDVINLGPDVKIELLGPPSPLLKEGQSRSHLNANSVVARVTHGNNCFLFTGDAEEETEERLLHAGLAPCAVLKVAHHGSAYATSDAWLKAVRPEIALISVGSDNTYGHPAPSTMSRLQAAGAKVYRTDTMGAIGLESDGRTVTVRTGAPTQSARTAPPSTNSNSNSNSSGININTASASELEELPGIGAKRAEQIIAYRKANGPFSSCDMLEEISGIGAATVSGLRSQCRVR